MCDKRKIIFDGITFHRKKGTNYYYTSINNKPYKALHHYIWEFFNNIKIKKGYVIHHIDFDPFNNEISNLQCMKINDHIQLHSKERHSRVYSYKESKCLLCGKILISVNSGRLKKYCDTKCRGRFKLSKRKILKLNCIMCEKEFNVIERLNKNEQRIACSRKCTNRMLMHFTDKDISNARNSQKTPGTTGSNQD